jgi:hypothetical protein
MALRDISLQSSAAVAFGGKRTSSGRQGLLTQSRMTQLGPTELTHVHVPQARQDAT